MIWMTDYTYNVHMDQVLKVLPYSNSNNVDSLKVTLYTKEQIKISVHYTEHS